jgi:Zn-dependent peptidase ImmA (M78 family)/DNA-binding XRE family transcriptional regulator
MLGARIKQARQAAGLSLRELADLVGISAMAISKYERDEIKPSSDVLLRLAKALDVRTEYFFRQTTIEVEAVEYRKHPKLPAKEERRIYGDVMEQIERWLELELFIPSPWSKAFELPKGLPKQVASMDEIEDVCSAVRNAWNLGQSPIQDLIEVLEEVGIKVFLTKHDSDAKFDGMSAKANGQPIIVAGSDKTNWPGDRQRFTIAHELGHLILKGRLSKDLDEEKACHRFAGAFLVPKEEAIKALGARRTWIEPRELYLLKSEWGLSMNAWIHRAGDLGIVNQATCGKLWKYFAAQGWRKTEPGAPYPHECALQYKKLVFRALGEQLIGESKAAELLGMSLTELNAQRRMEVVAEADCQ